MPRIILTYGAVAGLIVISSFLIPYHLGQQHAGGSLFMGYLVMLLALSLIFVAVKRHRDRAGGGVIRFWPALQIGLGISAVAGAIYVIGWEISLAATHFAFVDSYASAMIEAARVRGPAAVAEATAQAQTFRAQYANPLIRLPMTFVEIFPVGVAISLVSAALLRNARFLPAAPLKA
jgi:hypothetical protein